MRIPWLRVAAVWLLIASLEVVHGIARALVITPRLGDLRSRQVGVFTGSVLVLLVAFATSRWLGVRRTPSLLLVGFVWVVLMLAFEISVGRLTGASWERLWSDYNVAEGGLLPFGFVVLALAPTIAAWARRGRRA